MVEKSGVEKSGVGKSRVEIFTQSLRLKLGVEKSRVEMSFYLSSVFLVFKLYSFCFQKSYEKGSQ